MELGSIIFDCHENIFVINAIYAFHHVIEIVGLTYCHTSIKMKDNCVRIILKNKTIQH